METKDRRSGPPGLVSQDDGGLWMKMDPSPVTDHTETQSVTSGEDPQDETRVIPPADAMITRYYTEDSTGAKMNNSSVTHSTGATDDTEAKANPSGLDWHHGEKQLMAAQNKVDEVIASTAQTSEESMDAVSLYNDKDQTSTEGTVCLMETCHDLSGRHHQDNSTRDKESDEDDDLESSGPPELCKHNETGSATNQRQVPESPAEVTNEDHEEHVDARSLNYKLTKNDWVRKESGEAEVPQHLVFEGSEGTMTKGELGDGSKRIVTDIQQGEQLLQRLQLVQQRQDVHMSQLAQETRGKKLGVCETEVDDSTARGVNLTDRTEVKESRIPTVTDEGVKMNMMEKEKNEENESEDSEKASMSLSTIPEQSKDQRITRTEFDNSDEDKSDSWVQEDLSPINPHETPQTPLLSAQHRLSAAGTSMERQIQEANQGRQILLRAGGIFNLTDNPDVLEIPFKTAISLEPLPSQVGQGQRSDWQFSEQKMQKEISQEIQRELVLVNQGKIPGVYSKGEVRQLKETKLLFEAFQQDNTEGPTRIRKLPSTLIRHPLYPSVLERTHSLETFSLKSCSLSRAYSLRLYESAAAEGEEIPEKSRSKSPTGGARDKTRLFPYPKQDKHPRLCRSMDSVSTDASTSAVENRSKSREGNARQESPILQRNPFFKLRPARSLQPEVEKDIREAKEREEELRRQRCTLYGEDRQCSQEEEKSRFTKTHVPDARQQSRGKLERVWPPPSKKDQFKSEQTQVIQTSSQCLAFYLNDRPPKLIWISGSLQPKTDAHGVKALPGDRGRAAALLVAGAQRHLQIDATSQFERSE
ncbi:putative dentin sialophosphoprotein-like [Scophthalmus maximus]|uniref:Putative dentin sialophosphoprotein-like n=1 Tax=Scophthalmus maximus TaxID=52904 RepID=A0A2U9CP99_SCOMX|nr:putative dentin sialophosphoprotein-like [Scophthalmus maximus]